MTAPVVDLRLGELRLQLLPAIGGAVSAFYSERDGAQHHWLRPASAAAVADAVPTGMACFPLLPFCNRIRDGRFRFDDRDIVLPPNALPSPHALHGSGWQQPWTVAAHDAASATLEQTHARGAWPWQFHASQHVQLSEEGATLVLTVRNDDSTPMPLGVGFHPYMPLRDATRLTAHVDAIWHSDSALLPTTLAHAPVIDQLREGVATADLLLDNNFTGWDHRARIDYLAADGAVARTLVLAAEAPLDFLVIYAPPGEDHFCVEPVSNCTDWPNFPASAHASVGGAVLSPGASYSVTMRLLTSWTGD